jgi:hypothetical protein
MDFSSALNSLSGYISEVSFFMSVLPFFAILLVYLLSRNNFWKVPKIAFLLLVVMTVYEIVTNSKEGNLIVKFQDYFSDTSKSSDFFYIYLPIFVFSIIISIIFSIIDKIRSKIEVKVNRLPR